jgi:DHA2 family multidrug resistance protein-like MFS transporter
VYRNEMLDASLTSVPADAMDAARSTLGAAVAVAEQLPGHLATQVTASAHHAFTQALELTAITSAAIVMVTAMLAARLARRAQR